MKTNLTNSERIEVIKAYNETLSIISKEINFDSNQNEHYNIVKNQLIKLINELGHHDEIKEPVKMKDESINKNKSIPFIGGDKTQPYKIKSDEIWPFNPQFDLKPPFVGTCSGDVDFKPLVHSNFLYKII